MNKMKKHKINNQKNINNCNKNNKKSDDINDKYYYSDIKTKFDYVVNKIRSEICTNSVITIDIENCKKLDDIVQILTNNHKRNTNTIYKLKQKVQKLQENITSSIQNNHDEDGDFSILPYDADECSIYFNNTSQYSSEYEGFHQEISPTVISQYNSRSHSFFQQDTQEPFFDFN